MSRALHVLRASPGMSVQDLGRPGFLTYGVSKGGAADVLALHEGAALLGQSPELAAIEMPAMGGVFRADGPLRIALTGAPMRAQIDGENVVWNASHLLPSGAELSLGAAERGIYGYLCVGGGVATDPLLGSRSVHISTGIGQPVAEGDTLAIGDDSGSAINRRLPSDPRFGGGEVRVVPSLQTTLFDAAEVERFQATRFRKDLRSNRMGARLRFDGDGFSAGSGLSILSEVIVPGDVQITGDGTPFVLMSECQTVGGYPRIATVLPADLPRVAQAPADADLRFTFVGLDEAVAIEARAAKSRKSLPKSVTDLVRDPRQMPDLLAYQLVGGVVDAKNTTEDGG